MGSSPTRCVVCPGRAWGGGLAEAGVPHLPRSGTEKGKSCPDLVLRESPLRWESSPSWPPKETRPLPLGSSQSDTGDGSREAGVRAVVPPGPFLCPQDSVSCRLVFLLMQYCVAANYYWLLVEGVYLYTLLALSVFSEQRIFRLYLSIGWGKARRPYIPTPTCGTRQDAGGRVPLKVALVLRAHCWAGAGLPDSSLLGTGLAAHGVRATLPLFITFSLNGSQIHCIHHSPAPSSNPPAPKAPGTEPTPTSPEQRGQEGEGDLGPQWESLGGQRAVALSHNGNERVRGRRGHGS